MRETAGKSVGRVREAFKLVSLLRGDPFCPPSSSGMLSPRDLSVSLFGDGSAIERNSSVEREKLGENGGEEEMMNWPP